MYAYNYGTGSQVPQGYAPNSAYGTAPAYPASAAFAPPPGFVTTTPPTPAVQVPAPSHTPTPALLPVQVPPGCYPIELVQSCCNEHKRGQAFPLHWALFVRTKLARQGRTTSAEPHGNFYELVGTPETHTAQFLPGVTFAPETQPDWRGTHVVGWVHPTQLGVFERVVRQVPVWRHRPEWRCQQWVFEVVSAVGGRHQGLYMDGVTFVGLQRHMGRLLEAWESGDI